MRLFLSLVPTGTCNEINSPKNVVYCTPSDHISIDALAQEIAQEFQLPSTPGLYLNEQFQLLPNDAINLVLSSNDHVTYVWPASPLILLD
jgi:hypothetical protein